MALPTAANSKALTLANVKEALANASWFQTWAGAADAAAARAKIIIEFRLGADLPTRPYVILRLVGYRRDKVALSTHGPGGGVLHILAVHDVSSSYRTVGEEANLDAENNWGALLDGLSDWQQTVGTVRVELGTIEELMPPELPDPAEMDEESARYPYWIAECSTIIGPEAL